MIRIQRTFNFEYIPNEIEYSYQTFETLFKKIILEKKGDTKDKEAIPICIFRSKASPLQAVIKFLKENRQLKFCEIAKILNRDPRTIWTEYNSIKDNSKISFSNIEIEAETIYIYTNIFKNRNLAPLEAISFELKTRGYSNKNTSLILKKSQKTIWTVIDRAKKKIPNSEKLITGEVMSR